MTTPPDKSNRPRLLSWRMARIATIGLACFATFIALLYAEEDWRGKRAWEDCKRRLEAKGIEFDWSKFIPPPVPDDENFFKAPGIVETDWVGRGPRDLSKRVEKAMSLEGRDSNSVLIAEIIVGPPGDSGQALRLEDTNTRAAIRKLVSGATGPMLIAPREFPLLARLPAEIHPVRIVISASQPPTTNILAGFFTSAGGATHEGPACISVQPGEGQSFRLTFSSPAETAEDFLARTDSLEPEFDAVRAALKRPYARMDGDYTQPYLLPIPDFVTERAVAQLLATRVECHLLLNHPEEAARDATLLHDMCGPLEAKPTGPMTLIAAMINVAVSGLYADTIGDGLRLRAWHEPQLAALEEQLARTDLIPIASQSFESEHASTPMTLENTDPAAVYKASQAMNHEKATWRGMLTDPLYGFWAYAPRGWIYQNMAHTAMLSPASKVGDAASGLIMPELAARLGEELKSFSKWSPYSHLDAIFIPNFTRAWETVARNQTVVNEALVACALERYRLAHGDYPETLAALAPQFLDKIPRDVIGGQPLHYRRHSDGTFLLYSIGWNEKDDGGQILPDIRDGQSLDSGDWVWEPGLAR
ncbi:MAG TPA: hypothetical protein VGO59_16155 [Verrucomicrobiae bacterium]